MEPAALATVKSVLVEIGQIQSESDEPGVDLTEGVLLPLIGGPLAEEG